MSVLKFSSPALLLTAFALLLLGCSGNERDNRFDPKSRLYVAPPFVDTTAPAISVTTYKDGARFGSGSFNIQGTANDNVNVLRVEGSVDNETFTPASLSGEVWDWSLDTTSLSNGQRTLYFRVLDTSENQATVKLEIEIDKLMPQAQLLNLPALITSDNTAAITISSENEVVAYRFNIDNTYYSAVFSIDQPISYSFLDGVHSIKVVVKNKIGTWQSDANATVYQWTVDTIAPTAVLSVVDPYAASYEVTGEGLVTYRLRINGGAWLGPFDKSQPVEVQPTDSVEVVGIDAAGNEQSIPAEDNRDFLLLSAETQDLNANGFLDAIRLTFNKPIEDASLLVSEWSISGVDGENFNSTTNGDVADDNIIYLQFTEIPSLNTAVTMFIDVGGGAVQDIDGNFFGQPSVNVVDGAPPVLIQTITTVGQTYQSLVFSEAVYGASTATCPADVITTASFSYTDTSGDGADGLQSVSSECGSKTVQLELSATSALTDEDDVIAGIAGSLFDAVGLEAVAFSVSPTVQSAGHYFRLPHVNDDTGDGLHSVYLDSGPRAGQYLVINGQYRGTSLFNPQTGSFDTGPELSYEAGGISSFNITAGSQAGKILIVHGYNDNRTSLFDPADLTIVAGPTLSDTSGDPFCFEITSGTHSGKTLVIHGNNNSTTSLFDPVTATFSAGPALSGAADDGTHAFAVNSGPLAGLMLVVHSKSTTTSTYDPSSHTFSAGPTLGASPTQGAHSITLPSGPDSGKVLTLHGNTTSSLFDPATGGYSAGDSLPVAGGYSSHYYDSGIYAGKLLVFPATGSSEASLYDLATGTFSSGPTLPVAGVIAALFPSSGVFSDSAFFMSQTSESVTVMNKTDATFEVFYAPTNNFSNGSHAVIISSGIHGGKYLLTTQSSTTNLFDPLTGEISSGAVMPFLLNIGGGSFTIDSGTESGNILFFRGGSGTNTAIYDSSTDTFSTGPALTSGARGGAQAIKLTSGSQSGKTIIIHGDSTNTTSLFDPDTVTMSAGPALSDTVDNGASHFLVTTGVNAGKVLVIHADSSNTTSLLDFDTATFSAGPTLSQSAYIGSHSIAIQTGIHAGKTMVVHALNTGTSLYDPSTGTFSAGPTLATAPRNGALSFTIESGDKAGSIITLHAFGSKTTSLYDPVSGTYSSGPDMGATASTGSFVLQLASGRFAGRPMIFHSGKPAYSLYIP